MPTNKPLPDFLSPFFWDVDFSLLVLPEQIDFITRRLLQHGNWQTLTWLRNELGDPKLRQWIEKRRGAGLSPRQLRFWELVLDLPHRKVNRWVHKAAASEWQRKMAL